MSTFYITIAAPSCVDVSTMKDAMRAAIHTEYVLSSDDTLEYAKVKDVAVVNYPFCELEIKLAEQTEQIAHLEALRPEWAKGYSSDAIAASLTVQAKLQLWKLLGVNDQTAAVVRLKKLLNKPRR